MKYRKGLAALLSLAAVWGCVKENAETPRTGPEIEIDTQARVFNAYAEKDSSQTKTYLGSDGLVYWNGQDRVSVFAGESVNQEYVFAGNTGDRGGLLRKAAVNEKSGAEDTKAVALDANYAVYPYDSGISISEDGIISLELPAVQDYAGDGFGPGANTMVAVTKDASDDDFLFRNVGGYLVLNLYGDISVSSVTLTGNNGEKLSGAASVSIGYGKSPEVTMEGNARQSVTLDCGSGVTLGRSAETATRFCFTLPPVHFSKGFTIYVTDTGGKTFTKFCNLSQTVARNEINYVSACKVYSKAGQFVAESAPSELYDKDKVKKLVLEYGGDYIPSGIIGTMAVNLLVSILEKNGEISLHRIIYTTTDRDGCVVEASGLVAYPTKIKTFTKVLNVCHQTVDIKDAPSEADLPYLMCAAFKEGNQVVAMADYLGYGISRTADLQHPYMHSSITGNTCADMFEAAMQFMADERGVRKGNTLAVDLIGYSQGGAAVVSTLVELENRGYSSKINEVRVGGCPFRLEDVVSGFIEDPSKPYPHIEFLPLFFRGMDYACRLNLDFREIYARNVFDSGAFALFDNTQISSWHNRLGSDTKKVLHPDFFLPEYNHNPEIIRLIDAAARNSVADLTPKNARKIKIYQSRTDEVMDYDRAKEMSRKWSCSFTDLEKTSHGSAGVEFFGIYMAPNLWDLIKGLVPEDL